MTTDDREHIDDKVPNSMRKLLLSPLLEATVFEQVVALDGKGYEIKQCERRDRHNAI